MAAAKRPVEVAPARIRRRARARGLRRERGGGERCDAHLGSGLFVGRPHERRGLLRGFERVGDDQCDRLPIVEYGVVLQELHDARVLRFAGRSGELRCVRRRQHRQHAWHGLRRGRVNRGDPPARNRGADDDGVGDFRHCDVGRVRRLSEHLGPTLDAVDGRPHERIVHDRPPTVSSARTSVRWASSTLKALCAREHRAPEGSARGRDEELPVRRFSDDRFLGLAAAPRLGRHAAEGDACRADGARLDVERHGGGGQRECVGRSIAHFEVPRLRRER